MPVATLRLDIPERVWIGAISRQYPETAIRILAVTSSEESGAALAEITGPETRAVVGAMEDAADVTSLELIQHGDGTAIVQFETTMPLLLAPARDSGTPPELPIEVANGEVVWEVTAPTERLSQLGEQLEAFGIGFTVESVRQRMTDEQLLTETQRTLLEQAVEAGYYDTPREASLTEVAEASGLAKSTASETLHRAEEAIVKNFLDRVNLPGTALSD